MAEDWLADVHKYAPGADPGDVAGIVRYCGIALRNRDSSLVSFSSPEETGRVRENFLNKKLALDHDDSRLDEAIASVGERMKADPDQEPSPFITCRPSIATNCPTSGRRRRRKDQARRSPPRRLRRRIPPTGSLGPDCRSLRAPPPQLRRPARLRLPGPERQRKAVPANRLIPEPVHPIARQAGAAA